MPASTPSPDPLRVIVADDEEAVLEALCELIGNEPDLALVGSAGDASAAA